LANLLVKAIDWLDEQRLRHMSETVTYSRGAESVEVPATLGSTGYEVADERGAVVHTKAMDFLISAADLVLGGQKTRPKAGDRIRVTFGAEVHVFEVMDLAGTGHYRPCDPHDRTLRVHTKRIDEEEA
jgi:hypothetical protein